MLTGSLEYIVPHREKKSNILSVGFDFSGHILIQLIVGSTKKALKTKKKRKFHLTKL